MSGHSHSANIAIRKGKQDRLRARAFSKLSKDIMIAAREGADPDSNFALRHAVDKARAVSMPKDKIEHAIKRGAGLLEGISLSEAVLEGYAPGGVAVLLEVLTDNMNRTAPQVRKIFEAAGGKAAGAGAVQYVFKRTGVFRLAAEGLDENAVMERALEVGADDVVHTGESFEILCAAENFDEVKKALAAGEPCPDSAQFGFKAENEIEADAETAAKVFRLFDRLEEHDDVSAVYTNLKWTPEIRAAYEEYRKQDA